MGGFRARRSRDGGRIHQEEDLKETTGGEFRKYRASIRLLEGIYRPSIRLL